jgi:Ca-activated chloride channel family protein
MQMAYDEAKAHFSEDANNRIIMCTDGDFNVGVSSTEALVEMVESYQKSGIYLSIMGFGTGNFDDSRMESLSNHGNGTYNYIDSEEEMIKVFVNERSHFYSVANDTKCQVRFNPEAVAQYRLLGYENRLMSQEEFEDSSKDAGEIGAGQTVTALYEVIPADGYTKDASLATFETRYKFSLKDTESRSLTADVKTAESASENLNFAAGVAAYALVLRESEYKGSASLSLARELVNGARTFDPDGFRAQLVQLMDKLKD